ncbi:MAG: DUF5711 family protein [Roseburia sp.]|nr:DUF5711 family protein [Roseburia sp.]MCM1099655.1 DUF5711 family protein [Ruminococcus flavefaciens]
MADIKSYMKEKEKRERRQAGYQEKIIKHKLTNVYRILLAAAAAVALAALIVVQYKRHIYTDYDIVASVERSSASGALDRRLGSSILTYSKDGAHCTDAKGKVAWNQTYEFQDIKLAVCGSAVAIGAYNGRNVYVQNTEKQLSQITTNMPIRDLTVSAEGHVAVVLDGTNSAMISVYGPDGTNTYNGMARMTGSGYPAAVCLSPDGELLCVAYWYVDAGVIKTNVTFYNFGPVGENVNDGMVSNYSYTDMLIPQVQFMNDSTSFAVGDSRLIIYRGEHTPKEAAWYMVNEEIQSVFYSDKYIGLVFRELEGENPYRMDVYSASAEKIGSFGINIDYTDIFFGQDNFVAYNESECVIKTLDNIEKYSGEFSEQVRLMLPAGSSYRYYLVTDNAIDTIQLK